MDLLTKKAKNDLIDEIAGLRVDVKTLTREREAAREELALADQITDLKRQIADLKADESRIREEHARERREVEHQVGLQRKRQEFELESAKRDTELTVREENLHAEQERFDRDMTFQREELGNQVAYLKDLMEKLFERLPSASMTLKGALVSASNGHRDDE